MGDSIVSKPTAESIVAVEIALHSAPTFALAHNFPGEYPANHREISRRSLRSLRFAQKTIARITRQARALNLFLSFFLLTTNK